MVIRFFVCFIFACMYLLNWKRNDRHVFLLTLASFSWGIFKTQTGFCVRDKSFIHSSLQILCNILRNKDKTAFHSFSLDSVCNQVLIFQNLFHIQKFTVFFLHTVNIGVWIMFILIWPQKFDHEINIWLWDIWPWDQETCNQEIFD